MIIKLLLSFLVGGLFCSISQILIDKTSLTPAKILVLYVVFGVFLGATGVYDFIFEYAGAGISLPLIGFGGAIARGVKESIDNYGIIGIIKGPLSAMSAGLTFSLFLGYIYSLLAKAKSKKL